MGKNFLEILEDLVKESGGSLDKINLKRYIEDFNRSFVVTPWNYWLGVRILKNPFDLMTLQEIIFEKKPDTIIETGTAFGGSSYYMACLMDLIKIDGKIITIDNQVYETPGHPKKDLINMDGKVVTLDYDEYNSPVHPKIEYIHSDCLTAKIPKREGKTMVVLDCDHSLDHVYKELVKFSGMVTLGQYIIVEDTDEDQGEGAGVAVEMFLAKNKNFIVDKSREKFGITNNPGGYLLKIA